MNNVAIRLPAGFEVLEEFVDDWAVEGANSRLQRRLHSTESDRVTFFDTASKLALKTLELLDKKPLGELDEQKKALMNLILSLAHVSLAAEVQRDQEGTHAGYTSHITITQASSDIKP